VVTGTNIFYVRCNDTAGNTMNTSSTITFSVAAAAAADTSQTSGASGIVTKPTIEGVSVSRVWDVINPGTPVILTVSKAEIPVTEITIRVSTKVTNAEVAAGELTAAPTTDKVLATEVYKYMQIAAIRMTDNDISSVDIKFKVSKSWLTENGVSEDDIVLTRYNGDWTELSTTKLSSDSDYVYYEATAPGLSYYAITTQKAVAGQLAAEEAAEATAAEQPEIQGEQIPPAIEGQAEPIVDKVTPTKANIAYGLIIAIIILAAGLTGYLIYAARKKKK
jgi:PGF-pre-PGF domain-containing protein